MLADDNSNSKQPREQVRWRHPSSCQSQCRISHLSVVFTHFYLNYNKWNRQTYGSCHAQVGYQTKTDFPGKPLRSSENAN